MTTNPPEVSVLVLCKDLLFSSQLHGAVQRAGRKGRTCLSQEGCLKQLSDSPAQFILVDLELPQLDLAALKAAAGPECRLITYGPHVREDLFAAADSAGVDAIFTRGQAVAQIERILAQQ